MPLIQPLPSTWSSQHLIANGINVNISDRDYIISNSGMSYGTSGKILIALKMPFCSFYISNQGTGTAVIVFKRASDLVPLYATAIQPITSTTGDQFRNVTLPVTDPQGLTFSTIKTGTIDLSIVANGITDSGLLPLPGSMPEVSSVPGGSFAVAGGVVTGGSQTVMGGIGK